MKFLITGITGFAGPHLANLLHKEGHEIHGLIRGTNGMETDILDIVPDHVYKDIKFHYSNLSNLRLLTKVFQEHKFDGVFHLAAQSHPPSSFTDPIGTFEDNIMGSANLIQVISDLQPDCKLMFCSTSEVYGNSGIDGRKIHWQDKLEPSNPYGTSKAAIDLYMQERMTNGKIKGFITRAFSHTGPRRGKNFSISSDAYQIARMIKGHQEKVLQVGNLESVRVVIDVRDCVRAYYLAMIHPNVNKSIFNVCGDVPQKMGFFTDKLIELSGLEGVQKEINPLLFRPVDIHYQHGDSSTLVGLTGWKPEYTIENTLKDLLQYWVNKIN